MVKSLIVEVELHKRGYSSVGRAPALQAGCHRFESGYLHQIIKAGDRSAERKLQNGPVAQLVRARA